MCEIINEVDRLYRKQLFERPNIGKQSSVIDIPYSHLLISK